MSSSIIHAIGFTAAFMTTFSLLPQVVKTYRTRHTRDLSLGMLIIFNAGLILWFIYGIMLKSPPMVFGNFLTMIMAVYLLGMKIKYK